VRKLVPLPVFALAALVIAGCGGGGPPDHATIEIHYSSFVQKSIEVPAGKPVTLTLKNDDPIEHEWIIGTADVHERHRTGTEPHHDTIPTEVTVPAFETRVTMITFDHPGDLLYICHLPGHEQYGMVGTLHVVEG
jgi:uncharacterized cupredoxin-like copper-binding protein